MIKKLHNKELKEIIVRAGKDISKCQICKLNDIEQLKKYGVSLCVHHIDGNKQNNHYTNLGILCSFCHFSIHHFKRTEAHINKIIKLNQQRWSGKTWEEVFGKERAEQMRINMSNLHKGNTYCLGIPKSEEHKRNLSIAKLGSTHKPHSKETKLKMSETRKKLWLDKAYKDMMYSTNWKKPMEIIA